MTVNGSSSLNTRRQPHSEPIIIDDLGDETATAPRPSGRKRRRESDIIDIDLGEEGRMRSRLRVPPEYSSSRLQPSEVIVIDD